MLGRLVALLVNEAALALQAGEAPGAEALGEAATAAGHRLGPCAWGDEIGLDVVVVLLGALRATHGERFRPAPLLRRLVAGGALGVEAGRGFHDYEPHEAEPVGD